MASRTEHTGGGKQPPGSSRPSTRARGTPASRRSSPRGEGAPSRRGPRSRKALGRKRRAAAIAVAVVCALTVLAGIAMRVVAGMSGPGRGAPIVLEIPAEARATDVARVLAEAGAVRSELVASLYLDWFGDPRRIDPGTHIGDDAWSIERFRTTLERDEGRSKAKIVIPEGLNRFQIADRLEQGRVASREAFLARSADPLLLEALGLRGPNGTSPESAEGFLFPATYDLPVNTPAQAIVERFVRESDARWSKIAKDHAAGLARLETELGWTRREIVTLASVVEKETGSSEERPMVASVFLNRLRDPAFSPKLLQSDPTTGYGCVRDRDVAPSCAKYEGKVTGEMNRDRLNAYSTYVHDGLPPGPISNPGAASLAAVLDPTPSRFFYFVAKGGGRHTFSETYDAHLKAVRGAPP